MSWQAYVDDSLVKSGFIDKAAIYCRTGDSVWAQSPDFQLKPQELKTIVAGFDNNYEILASGMHVCGQKYLTIRADDRSIYGKWSQEGIVCVRTKLAILIGHYPAGIQVQQATGVVEKLADYLIGLEF
ncbi:Profilin [Neolecta irregularis DAH-3]|uniref:Profilin n=1 Tax=Neolecta irregularis (strain DAH-3) TaxID=1198029 RepID=A0A1U7LH64_NEOID|nr:Profilin [Neolecta irregularis DAH-3]|eukprot:OLL21996.1 Profilin [Neolecta irregularis DAH-3]